MSGGYPAFDRHAADVELTADAADAPALVGELFGGGLSFAVFAVDEPCGQVDGGGHGLGEVFDRHPL